MAGVWGIDRGGGILEKLNRENGFVTACTLCTTCRKDVWGYFLSRANQPVD